jgi:hypothetical protein
MTSAQRPAAPDPSSSPAGAGTSPDPAESLVGRAGTSPDPAGGRASLDSARSLAAPDAASGELAAPAVDAQAPQPVALLYGRGRLIVHGNPAFIAEFGAGVVGLPASEALPDWPHRVFEVIDRAFDAGRPVAAWVSISGARRRLTVAPRADLETGETYGVAIRLATDLGSVPAR